MACFIKHQLWLLRAGAVGSAAQMLTFWGTNALFTLAYKFQPAWIEYYKVSMKPWPWNGSPKVTRVSASLLGVTARFV